MDNSPPCCRFCLDTKATRQNPFLSPCLCRGSVELVHFQCLQRWRVSNPPLTLNTCTLCKEEYTLPERFLGETIPVLSLYSILQMTEIWTMFVFYIFTFHANAISSYPFSNSRIESLIPIYVHSFELLFFAEFSRHWHVRSLGVYIQEIKDRRAWILPLFHIFITLSVQTLNNKYPYFLMPYSLACMWNEHTQILAEMNNRLMRGIL